MKTCEGFGVGTCSREGEGTWCERHGAWSSPEDIIEMARQEIDELKGRAGHLEGSLLSALVVVKLAKDQMAAHLEPGGPYGKHLGCAACGVTVELLGRTVEFLEQKLDGEVKR